LIASIRLAVGPQLVGELQTSPAATSTGSDLVGVVVGEVVIVAVDDGAVVVDVGVLADVGVVVEVAVVGEGTVVVDVDPVVVVVVVVVVVALDDDDPAARSTTNCGAFGASRLPKCLLFSLIVVSSML
jgi:hypothetical protein